MVEPAAARRGSAARHDHRRGAAGRRDRARARGRREECCGVIAVEARRRRRGRSACHRAGNIHASPLKFEIDPQGAAASCRTRSRPTDGSSARSTTRTRAPSPTRPRPTSTSPPTGRAWSGSSSGSPAARAGGALLPDRGGDVRGADRGDGEVSEEPLVCPGCARTPSLRALLRGCGMPLVHSRTARRRPASAGAGAQGQPPVHRGRAREGRPCRQPPAGRVPRRAAAGGGDPLHAPLRPRDHGRVPPVVGPRDVLVPESAAEAAREALAYSAASETPSGRDGARPARRGPAGRRRW